MYRDLWDHKSQKIQVQTFIVHSSKRQTGSRMPKNIKGMNETMANTVANKFSINKSMTKNHTETGTDIVVQDETRVSD